MIKRNNKLCYICESKLTSNPKKYRDCDMYGNKQQSNICDSCYDNEIGKETWVNKCRHLPKPV